MLIFSLALLGETFSDHFLAVTVKYCHFTNTQSSQILFHALLQVHLSPCGDLSGILLFDTPPSTLSTFYTSKTIVISWSLAHNSGSWYSHFSVCYRECHGRGECHKGLANSYISADPSECHWWLPVWIWHGCCIRCHDTDKVCISFSFILFLYFAFNFFSILFFWCYSFSYVIILISLFVLCSHSFAYLLFLNCLLAFSYYVFNLYIIFTLLLSCLYSIVLFPLFISLCSYCFCLLFLSI